MFCVGSGTSGTMEAGPALAIASWGLQNLRTHRSWNFGWASWSWNTMTLGSETSVEMHRVSVTGDHACLTRGKCHTKARYESQWMKLEEGTEFQDMAIKRGRERERERETVRLKPKGYRRERCPPHVLTISTRLLDYACHCDFDWKGLKRCIARTHAHTYHNMNCLLLCHTSQG